MEENQEQKFVCKFCSKSCFSGQSLGGHMRVHLALISAKKLEDHTDGDMGSEVGDQTGNGLKANPKTKRVSDSNNSNLKQEKPKNSNMVAEGGWHASYGLRENPKKSWRVSGSKHGNTSRKEEICRECGKGFHTLRALSVHMRCHSMKEKEENLCKKCGKGFDSMKALFGHMRSHSKRARVSNESAESQSHYETTCPIRRKKSRIRYKITVNSSLSSLNASLSVSGNEEVEEVALCLMMLSKGVNNWGEFNSVTEFSENNSAFLEAQSLDRNKGIDKKDGEMLVCDGDVTWKMKRPREKVDSSVSGSGNFLFKKNASEFNDFDSGFVNDDEKTVELKVSVDGFLRGNEFKKLKEDDQSGIDLCYPGIEKGIESTEMELEKDLMEEVELDQADSELTKSNSSKFDRFDVHDPELGENSCDRTNATASDYEIPFDFKKKDEYECRTCNKVFHSYRALGGHRASHKTINSNSVLKMESCKKSIQANLISDIEANSKHECNEDSLEEGLGGVAVTSKEFKKIKEHECPVCFKVFASGQALGGHKRAHSAGFSESGAKETMLVEQELPIIHNTFDLNLPIPLEKEANVNAGFNLWWFGSNHEHEPLVISN